MTKSKAVTTTTTTTTTDTENFKAIAHNEALLAVKAFEAMTKKNGEYQSRLIVAMLSAYKAGCHSIAVNPAKQNDKETRNKEILEFFGLATETKNAKNKAMMVPAKGVNVDSLAGIKTAINVVSPIVQYVIAGNHFNDVSLSKSGLLQIKGSLIAGDEAIKRLGMKELGAQVEVSGKAIEYGYTDTNGKLKKINIKRSIAAIAEHARQSLNIQKETRKPKQVGEKVKPVTAISSLTVHSALELTLNYLMKLESLKETKGENKKLLEDITLQIVRLHGSSSALAMAVEEINKAVNE